MRTRRDLTGTLVGGDAKAKPDIELQQLSAINNALPRLAHGDVPSHVVLEFVTLCQRLGIASNNGAHASAVINRTYEGDSSASRTLVTRVLARCGLGIVS